MSKRQDISLYTGHRSVFRRIKNYFPQSNKWQSLYHVIETDGFYILMGALSGLGLVILQEVFHIKAQPGWRHIAGLVIEHTGLGLFVSSIAVFGYEWRSNAKRAMDLSQQLVELRQMEGMNAIQRGLVAVFGDEEHAVPENLKKGITGLKKVIVAIEGLNKSKSWANQQYIGFVADLIETARSNAENLSFLDDKKVDWKDFIVPVTAADLADNFLAKHMRALTINDKYHVISNFSSWQGDQLKNLHEATKIAVENGAEIIRVFNLLSLANENIPVELAKTILEKHLAAAKEWKGVHGYTVKVFGQAQFNKLKKLHTHADIGISMQSHFGVFIHGEEIICVMVKDPNLSKMQICAKKLAVQSETEQVEEVIRFAETLDPDKPEQLNTVLSELKKKVRRGRRQVQA